MARISTYGVSSPAVVTDELIGSDIDKATKNFTVGSIIDITGIPAGTDNTLSMFGPGPSLINSIVTQTSEGSINVGIVPQKGGGTPSNPFWIDDFQVQGTMSVSGKVAIGTPRELENQGFDLNILGEEGKIAFGDNNVFGDPEIPTPITWNVVVGEYGTGDTDILQLHGKVGTVFTRGALGETVSMNLDDAGRLGINTTGPLTAQLTVGGNVDIGEFQLSTGQVVFDQSPTGTAGVGVLRWNNTDGTLDLGLKGGNVTLQIGQEEVALVVNKSGIDLLEADFKVVKVLGAQGQRLSVDLAQADSDVNSATTLGVVTETILNNAQGFITTVGMVNNINATGAKSFGGLETWNDGDVLYLDPVNAGYMTNVKPITPAHLITIGYVVNAANNGKIYVKIDNGYELDELHDVKITGLTYNDLLAYDSYAGFWRNVDIIEIGGVTTKSPGIGNYIAKFDSSSAIEPSTLIYDNGVGVGIGTTIAGEMLNIEGKIALNYGDESISIGRDTGGTGNKSVAIGPKTLSNSSGSFNVGIGTRVMEFNSTGSSNTAVGRQSMLLNTTGSENVAIGYDSMYYASTGQANVAVGYKTLYENRASWYNTGIGYQALSNNNGGQYNTAVGSNSLFNNTSGEFNSAFGDKSLISNTTGGNNTAIGNSTLGSNTAGSNNTAVGLSALNDNTTGGFNTGIGLQALGSNTTGTLNTAIGWQAGRNANGATNTSSSTSVFIGAQTKSKNSSDTNQIVIGYGVVGNGSNTATIGGNALSALHVGGNGAGLVLKSPNGTSYKITVDNSGNLVTTAI